MTANKADAYLALSEKIQREQERLALIKAEIISTTAKVQDAALRALLIEHYVNGRTRRETAERMNYNEVHVRGKMHARALRQWNKYAQAVHNIVENGLQHTTKDGAIIVL